MKTLVSKICVVIFLGLAVVSCTKKLPKEEQQRLQKEANERKIQRVTEGQLLKYVQDYGNELQRLTRGGENPDHVLPQIRSLLGDKHKVEFDIPSQAGGTELREIVRAYMFSIAEGSEPGANIQTMADGNILYTLPQIRDSAGIKVLEGLYRIEFMRKAMVNEIATAE